MSKENETKKYDTVNNPYHYASGGIECIDAMVAAFGEEEVKTFCKLNAFKYIWRTAKKNGLEDVKKAIWYLEKLKKLEEKSKTKEENSKNEYVAVKFFC